MVNSTLPDERAAGICPDFVQSIVFAKLNDRSWRAINADEGTSVRTYRCYDPPQSGFQVVQHHSLLGIGGTPLDISLPIPRPSEAQIENDDGTTRAPG